MAENFVRINWVFFAATYAANQDVERVIRTRESGGNLVPCRAVVVAM